MTAQTAVERLAHRRGSEWPAITRCRAAAGELQGRIRELLNDASLVASDCQFVAFGSLARLEITKDSDVDWTLLVDGRADPQHQRIALEIADALERDRLKSPGRTGTFGQMSFSHDLIHRIGGQADTNFNTTRRVLLLLESVGIEAGEIDVRERVIRQLFRRYLDEDRGYHSLHAYQIRVPRLLLNDVVRYWRTMAVDFAAKRRERTHGWALRNVKLRASRKLMFAAGLAMCLLCEVRPRERLRKLANQKAPEEAFYAELAEFLWDFTNKSPLDILAEFGSEVGAEEATCELFDSYDEFLALLDDDHKRSTLDKLGFEDAATNKIYLEARKIGTGFQRALTKIFFETDDDLTRLTQRYGVF